MSHKALVIFPIALLTLAIASPTTSFITFTNPEYSHRCTLIDSTYICDFKDIQPQIHITKIEAPQDKTIYIHNAKSMKINGWICSNIEFKNSYVELKESSSCLVKLDFKNTKVDSLPFSEDAQNIFISDSEITELRSQTLKTADIFNAKIQLLEIESPSLTKFKARNTTISKLNQFNLPKGSVVTFIGSNVITAKNTPFSFNGGILDLQDTPITLLSPPLKDVSTVKNTIETNLTPKSLTGVDKKTGLEVTVGILSVAVAVLMIIQFITFIRKKKLNDSGDSMYVQCQDYNCSTHSVMTVDHHCEGCNCSSENGSLNDHHCQTCNCSKS